MAIVHVIGAGIAGLSCAVRLASHGTRVALYEATDHGGGRCRSYTDAALGRTIDNGNHLLLTCNDAALGYLESVGARDTLIDVGRAVFPFVDLANGARWALRPNDGRIPWWIFAADRRIPGTRVGDYLSLLSLMREGGDETVAAKVAPSHPLYRPLVEPFTVAVLNAAPSEAAAALLAPVLRATFGRGGAACRGLVVRDGLSASFVEPGLRTLTRLGATLHFNHRLREFAFAGDRVVGLRFAQASIDVAPEDRVVLAVPPRIAAALLPGLGVPEGSRAILNLHFRLPAPPSLKIETPYLGVLGGVAQWLFLRGDVVSVTISAADALIDQPAEALAALVWRDVTRALALPPETPIPAYRVIKEHQATFAQIPQSLALRPPTRTRHPNMALAGDWTATGLPATIEGAATSGQRAAACVASL
jgi:squalene-associated FAD-dependent desaturase